MCCLTGGGICVLLNWRGDLCVVSLEGGFVCCLTGGGICVLFNWREDLCVV